MPLTIPKEYARGLAALSSLSAEEFKALAGALADVPATTHKRKDIATFIESKIGEGRVESLESLVRALLSLYQARAFAETPPIEKFVDDLADAVVDSGMPEFTMDAQKRAQFVSNMRELLNVDTLVFLAKADALQRDHEKLFHSVKLLTDLRPVFHAPDDRPTDMILEYMLKIVFHDGSRRHREIHLAMDERDVKALRDAVERAEQKAKSLRSLCDEKSIKLLPTLTEA